MSSAKIILKNVKVHNLQGVDLELEPNRLITFTGVSGSGKSSLAFDTLYMEGQRRYIESLSSYARKQMGSFPKPEADAIEGVSPTVAIEQKTMGKNPRSTVGTLTGIHDFLRVLFARIAIPYCPVSQERVTPQSSQQIVETIFSFSKDKRIVLLSPYATGKKGEFKEDFADLVRRGFTRARVDGHFVDLAEELSLEVSVSHDVDVVVDRLVVEDSSRPRLIEAVQLGLDYGKGILKLFFIDEGTELLFSEHAYSEKSGLSYSPLQPQDFSFNHPVGMCPDCQGLGVSQEFSLDKILDPEKSLSEDCCKVASSFRTLKHGSIYRHFAKKYQSDVDTPWKDLPKKLQEVFLYGTKEPWTKILFQHPDKGDRFEYIQWKGVLFEAKERYLAAQSDSYKKKMQEYFVEGTCSTCRGSRLKPYPSAAQFQSKTIQELVSYSIEELLLFFRSVTLTPIEMHIGGELVKEISERLDFLTRVGLQYLSLDRSTPSLSGGEGQRVRLASQIGSGLVGATYILDEPSIGLHPRDNHKLLQTLLHLKDKGNTVIVVEHDEETIRASDIVVDVGPGAGTRGGKILSCGSVEELLANENSLTGAYLSGRLTVANPRKRKVVKKERIQLVGASHHNLRNLSVSFPLGVFVVVTGVSGSGKSSLIMDTLYPALSNHLQKTSLPVGAHERVEGLEKIDKVIAIDQSPIGRTPRSNPATYIKLFDDIRDLYCLLPASRAQGFAAGRFSFNVAEGCCPFCSGMGMIKVDMDFLEEEWTVCSSCQGRRFDELTLSVQFKGKNIHDVLSMTVEEAILFFQDQPKIVTKLSLLQKVGLDYITLGQPSPTLSGGEAQRIKLAKELIRPATGKTLYILDEPTTGLHFHDCKKLLDVLHSLVDRGNTIIVIEHNIDLIKTADWVIDLGPEAGPKGGEVIFSGTPPALSKETSPTGMALHSMDMQSKNTHLPSRQLSHLYVKGASQNNLKNIDVEIPLGAITVCTGPSGSGKSSFAFETLYAEGQRRYTESMSHYARQFVKQMAKPKVEKMEGLSASIAIEQKNHAGNPRSTVGTLTEIYEYLRILYCHLGTPFCPITGEEIKQISKEYVVNKALELPEGSKLTLLSPITLGKLESFSHFKEKMIRQGFIRIRLNGEMFSLEEEIPYDAKKKNSLFVVIDRVIVNKEVRNRLFSSIEQATLLSKDLVVLLTEEKETRYHLSFTVESTGISYAPLSPHTFSFNTEQGMCLDCQGLGFQYGATEELTHDLSQMRPIDLLHLLCKETLSGDAIALFTRVLAQMGIYSKTPLNKLPPQVLHSFFQGSPSHGWKGLNPLFIQYAKSSKGATQQILSSLLEQHKCPSCDGSRLNPLARHVKISGVSIADFCQKPIHEALVFLGSLSITEEKKKLLEEPLSQVLKRLYFLEEIGLGYLSLDRSAPTLSGGETQRIRLSRQLGSGLCGCLYVLDEPTIGLHPYDNHLVNKALQRLKNLNNTLVLVEHDPMTIQIADYIVDFGPGAGAAGGTILARGTLEEIKSNPNSLTGAYLSGKKKIALPQSRRAIADKLSFTGVSLHNVKDLTAFLPLKTLTCLTGVSGSGKSTLLMEILRPEIERNLFSRKRKGLSTSSFIEGIGSVDKLIVLNQDPIGTTNRANICTYTDLLTLLRYLYASLPEAKARGLQPKQFSYNHKKGMCSSCWGLGTRSISLQFLPTVKVECESCKGLRLNPLSLQVRYKGKNLGEVLQLSIEEASLFFQPFPKIVKILETLLSVGLGYLSLGQEIATLSGGESQRLRLSCELSKRSTGKTLYLFDEPSVGLHYTDIERLIPIFHALVDKGNTVVLIEHNLDLIAQCDYIIEMGPGPGVDGGNLVATGTPEDIAAGTSRTAPFLREHLS